MGSASQAFAYGATNQLGQTFVQGMLSDTSGGNDNGNDGSGGAGGGGDSSSTSITDVGLSILSTMLGGS